MPRSTHMRCRFTNILRNLVTLVICATGYAHAENCWQLSSASSRIQVAESHFGPSHCSASSGELFKAVVAKATEIDRGSYGGFDGYSYQVSYATVAREVPFTCIQPANPVVGSLVYCGYMATMTSWNSSGPLPTSILNTTGEWFSARLSFACGPGTKWVAASGACLPIVDNYAPGNPPSCNLSAGNPIYPLHGNKREVVNAGFAIGSLGLSFTYDSVVKSPMAAGGSRPVVAKPASLGQLWTTALHRRILVQGAKLGALADRGDGRIVSFAGNGSGSYVPTADTSDRLLTVRGGFRYIDAAARSFENYDNGGNLLSIYYSNGESVNFGYSTAGTPGAVAPAPGYLIQATDNRGRLINLAYHLPPNAAPDAGGRISQITDPSGQTINFSYDLKGNLSSILWPDGSTRSFIYDDAGKPWALSGVSDELGVRYSTYTYDAAGRAVSTEYVGGVNKFSTSYATPPEVMVTEIVDTVAQAIRRNHSWSVPQGIQLSNPNGSNAGLTATSINGKNYLGGRSQPAGAGCAASSSALTYDANGNAASKDDFNGSRMCMKYEPTRNLPTVAVEGLAGGATGVACGSVVPDAATLPVGSRKTSTAWHPTWRLAVKVAAPGRMTTNVYNGQPEPFTGVVASCAPASAPLPDGSPVAVLCKTVEQATTDADGSLGFAGVPQADTPSRTTSYTYNANGQVLTAKGARTDLDDTTTYAYYADTTTSHTLGDLQSVTNAAGHVTHYTRYNKAGQLLESVGPNGVVTASVFDSRQRLLSTSVGGQLTSYGYDAAGQLIRVTQPDASYVGFEYDAAHRQTAVFDNRGNRIEYALDNQGNRVAENVKDSSGALRRQMARSFDALGRLQHLSGRE